MQERRKSDRDQYTAQVSYTISNEPEEIKECIGRNICSEGISLHTNYEIEEGTNLSLSFLLYDEHTPISALGSVIWCQRIDEETVHVGIAFEEISAIDQARIISYIVRNYPMPMSF